MEERIEDKIKEIEECVNDLNGMVPESFEDYAINREKKAACEHYFERIVEALADLAFLFIKKNGFSVPNDDIAAFFVLAEKNIISNELAQKLKEAKGMRNFIIHQYGKINDELVFETLNGEIQRDVGEFLGKIRKDGRKK